MSSEKEEVLLLGRKGGFARWHTMPAFNVSYVDLLEKTYRPHQKEKSVMVIFFEIVP